MFVKKGMRSTRNGRRGLRGGVGGLEHPPQIHPAISGSKVFRFAVVGADTQTQVTQTELLNMVVVATTATASSRIFSSVRLRKVEAWAAPVQGNAPQLISIAGIGAGPENRKSDSSMGVTPAHVRWNPAPNSVADLWFETGASSAMFELTVPTNATVDVSIDYVLNCEDTPTAGPVPAGATAGTWYGVPLDGLGGNVQPFDYTLLP